MEFAAPQSGSQSAWRPEGQDKERRNNNTQKTDGMFEMLVLKLILITYSGHPESRINILFSI